MDALRSPARLPVLKKRVLFLQGLKASPLECRGLGVANCALDTALAIRVTDSGGISDYAIVREDGRIRTVKFWLIEIRADHPLLQVIQDHILGRPSEVAPCLLMQLSPDLLAGAPDHAPEAAPGIAQRHDKQAGTAIPVRAWHQGWCAFAIVHLSFLARGKREPIKLNGIDLTQLAPKSLDTVVATRKPEPIDQVLVDGGVVAAQAQLFGDERPVGFAQRLRP